MEFLPCSQVCPLKSKSLLLIKFEDARSNSPGLLTSFLFWNSRQILQEILYDNIEGGWFFLCFFPVVTLIFTAFSLHILGIWIHLWLLLFIVTDSDEFFGSWLKVYLLAFPPGWHVSNRGKVLWCICVIPFSLLL